MAKQYVIEDEVVTVVTTKYQNNGSLAVLLMTCGGDGEPPELYARASVNTDIEPESGCFWCKNYSENTGIDEWLISNRIAQATGRFMLVGDAIVPELKLLTQ